jgi:hypothetical protein
MTVGWPVRPPKRGLLVARAKSVARKAMLALDIGGLTTVALFFGVKMGSGAYPTLEEVWKWVPPIFRSEWGLVVLMGYLVIRGTYLSARGRAFFDQDWIQTDSDEGES